MDKEHQTSSGIDIPELIPSSNHSNPDPGTFPYTRGVHSSMYRKRVWTMRQYAGFSTAKESNVRYKELLKKGAKGLSVAFDLPTQMGLDSDDALALGEVGKVGVAIDTIADMRVLFQDIDLGKISTSMTINSTASILLMLYELVAEEKGISSDKLRGTIQNDILKEYMARGTYIYPPRPSLRIITNIFEYCSKNLPNFNTISISGYHIREAGSTAVQEVAFTLSNGLAYVEEALRVGLSIDEFAPRLSFFFNVHNNFLEEVAKFRAARRIWAKLIKEKYNPKNEKSLKLRFHSQVAGSTLTAQSPLNNIIRVTMQAMASILGGTQSLHTNSYDEALQLPTSESAEIALRTQQILAHESGLPDFVDPLNNSDAIEFLTDRIEEAVNDYFQAIEMQGGIISCIENGYIEGEISKAAYDAQKKIEDKEKIIVGVNEYQSDKDFFPPSNSIPEEVEKNQVSKLREFKEQRDQKLVKTELAKLQKAAETTDNLIPFIRSCMKNNCTLGEVSQTLRQVFGRYKG